MKSLHCYGIVGGWWGIQQEVCRRRRCRWGSSGVGSGETVRVRQTELKALENNAGIEGMHSRRAKACLYVFGSECLRSGPEKKIRKVVFV